MCECWQYHLRVLAVSYYFSIRKGIHVSVLCVKAMQGEQVASGKFVVRSGANGSFNMELKVPVDPQECNEDRKPPTYEEVLGLPRHDARPLSRHQYMILISNMQKKKPEIAKPWGIKGNWNDVCQERLEENLLKPPVKKGRHLQIKNEVKDVEPPLAIGDQPVVPACPDANDSSSDSSSSSSSAENDEVPDQIPPAEPVAVTDDHILEHPLYQQLSREADKLLQDNEELELLSDDRVRVHPIYVQLKRERDEVKAENDELRERIRQLEARV